MKKITTLLTMLLMVTISHSQTTIFSENFDGATLPTGWALNAADNSGSHLWTFGSGAVPGNVADFTTNAAIFDDDIAGNTGDHNRAWLYHNAVDVSSFNQITLEYEYALNVINPGEETLSVGLFDGSGWIIIRTYDIDTAPTLDTIDLAAALAANPGVDPGNLFIGFVYDDIDGGWAWGAGIDNVVLTGSNVITNDACVDAQTIIDGETIISTNVGATNIENIAGCNLIGDGSPACVFGVGGDGGSVFSVGVWYKYTSTSSETIIISTNNAGTDFDTSLKVWSGSCGSLTCVGADDDGDGIALLSTFCWLSAGSVASPVDYYIYVDGFDDTDAGIFELTITTDQSTVSTQDIEQFDFSMYPNPVNNMLSIVTQEIINKVSIYNVLGQEVKISNPETNTIDIDVTNLNSGVYIVKLVSGNKESTRKFVKK